MKKLNISGGEPFLKPDFIGEIFKFCKEDLKLESCTVVNNGSKVTEKWLDTYGKYVDIMAISCDSFDAHTNLQLGRAEKGKGSHVERVFRVAEWCKCRGIKVKINTVITRLNFEEDMNESIEALVPYRWKVFQVLLLDGENTGRENGSLRDARSLTITKDEFQSFLSRHSTQKCLVPEDNDAMKDSYLNLDENMRFLNSQDGGKQPGRSVLDVGVREALEDAGFDNEAFVERGGIFDWSRNRAVEDLEW
ncbi:radical SAM enzyme [Rickenella mellea]|uniref:Radical SAM enzyme n=1 Tax=Rickenella mellea TaxID=50990 RepID=A0A4Y7PW86_9AGAM|nr:radical SAM enzyme [Rickenella mellea]